LEACDACSAIPDISVPKALKLDISVPEMEAPIFFLYTCSAAADLIAT
jgi:hypothetical protein